MARTLLELGLQRSFGGLLLLAQAPQLQINSPAMHPWLDAYARGVDRFVSRAKAAGVQAYFFVDLVVLPTPVLEAWPTVWEFLSTTSVVALVSWTLPVTALAALAGYVLLRRSPVRS